MTDRSRVRVRARVSVSHTLRISRVLFLLPRMMQRRSDSAVLLMFYHNVRVGVRGQRVAGGGYGYG